MSSAVQGKNATKLSFVQPMILFAMAMWLSPVYGADSSLGTSDRSMVATVNPLATDAAVKVLREGGNAVDAAVAAALTLGVVDSHNSGIGGGCFILIHRADGTILAIDGREMAPAKAHRDMYLREGKPVTGLSQVGALAPGIPGSLAAYQLVLEKCGRRKLSDLILPAADIAEQGFAIDRMLASRLAAKSKDLARFPESKRIFLLADGTAPNTGDTLIQKNLAGTYRAIAEHGVDWFYAGPFAKSTEKWMKSNKGIITADDFKNYQVVVREPIRSKYRGHEVIGFPPPSSGGIHVAQILNVLANFNLKKIHNDDPALFVHVVAEGMKPAFADRAFWLGDSDFAKVPRGLLSQSYAKKFAAQIDFNAAAKVAGHGEPPNASTDTFNRHTTHIAAADAEGNWVAITTTINTSFGSKVVVPGTGVLLNNQMDDFSVAPGVPNAFGLVGAKANEVAPGKRPLSSMSPTIILRDGKPIMTVGAAGGPKIISEVVTTIVNHLDLGMPIDKAVGAKRYHHQWAPDTLFVEKSMDLELIKKLQAKNHKTKTIQSFGYTQAIVRLKNGKFYGTHDPRLPGKAAGH